jgi:photosystem II stability/assembly factor-like uncharacterized protein
MPKRVYTFVYSLLLAGILGACNLPDTAQSLPAGGSEQPTLAEVPAAQTNSPSQPGAVTQQPTAAALPATQTSLPATITAQPPTAVSVPGPAVTIDQIHMLTVNNGWAWASRDGNMNILLRTADGGFTWRDVSPKGDYTYYGSFFLSDQAAWLPYYNSSDNTGGLLHTTDGGQNWQALPPNDKIQNAWVDFSSTTEGLAETAGLGAGNAYLNYYQTRDGGVTWEPVPLIAPTPEPDLPTGTIHLCNICGDSLYYDAQRAIISHGDMAGDPTGLVRLSISTDLGAHWTELQLPLPDQKYSGGSVAPQTPTFFGMDGILPVSISKYNQDGSLAFSVLAIYSSQDGGQTWTAALGVVDNDKAYIDTVQVLSPRDAFVRCGKNLCATNDGGQSWRKLPDNLNFDQSAGGPDYVSQYHFVDPASAWAISGESGATTLWKSSDGGNTWVKLAPTLVQ